MYYPSPAELAQLSQEFETSKPHEILKWAVDTYYPHIAMSSSFQTQSIPLLHMIMRIQPEMRIFFLDTGYHFWDTLLFREQMGYEWQLNVVDLRRDERWEVFVRQNRYNLPTEDANLCCYLNKVQPMQKAMHGLRGWISGIRRDQTSERAQARIIEVQKDGLIKINPLLNWTRQDVQDYIEAHQLPSHPLLAKGYRSIGCAPCTQPTAAGQDERAGRWVGQGKTECGLHTQLFQKNLTQAKLSFLLDASKHPPGNDGEKPSR
jgi:phosphoadenosine phosphosulfate reductase